jgi:hypothetical protein
MIIDYLFLFKKKKNQKLVINSKDCTTCQFFRGHDFNLEDGLVTNCARKDCDNWITKRGNNEPNQKSSNK